MGTVTEIYDYLRLMYARIGVPHCPVCGKEISSQSVDQIVEDVYKRQEATDERDFEWSDGSLQYGKGTELF